MEDTIGTVNNRYLYKVNNFSRDVSQGTNESKGNLGYNGYSFYGTDDSAAKLGQNGRVNELNGFNSYKSCENNGDTFKTNALQGIHEHNNLSYLFFSNKNIEHIQKQIRFLVNQKTKKIIDKQDYDQLKIIMRSIYLQYGQNLDCEYDRQIARLNKKVTEYCVPQIVSSITQYYGYLKDITTMPNYMTHPVNVSSKGEKTYALDYFI